MRDSDRAAGSRELKDRREAVESPAAGAHTSASVFRFKLRRQRRADQPLPGDPASLGAQGGRGGAWGAGQSRDHQQSGARGGMLRAGTPGSVVTLGTTAVGWGGPWL